MKTKRDQIEYIYNKSSYFIKDYYLNNMIKKG